MVGFMEDNGAREECPVPLSMPGQYKRRDAIGIISEG
jgi:hypothetical protein